MIGDRNTAVPEIPCIFHNTFRITHSIHFTHVCMAVQFDAFGFCRIGDLHRVQLLHLRHVTDKVIGIFVIDDISVYADTFAFFDIVDFFTRKQFSFKALGYDRIFSVKY